MLELARVGAEEGHGQGEGGAGRGEVEEPAEQQDHRVGVGDQEPDQEGEAPACGGGERAGSRRERVGDDQLVAGDHPGQRGGEPGEDEPVDRRHAEGRHVEEPVGDSGDHQGGGQRGEDGAEQIAVEEDLAAAPTVEEDSGERADQGVREEEDRHGRGDGGGGGLLLGGEDDVGGEGDLEDAVGCLGEEADGEQPPEVPHTQEHSQVTDDSHGARIACGGRTGTRHSAGPRQAAARTGEGRPSPEEGPPHGRRLGAAAWLSARSRP